MKTSTLLSLIVILVGSALPAMAQYPVEEVGPLLDITTGIKQDTAIINVQTTDMDVKLTTLLQLVQTNIQPDIETMRKLQVNQADVALQLDKLTSLQQRGMILTGGGASGAAGGSVPVSGYNWNSATGAAQGLGGGFAGNYISPQFSMPFASLSQIPQALFPVAQNALGGLLSVASNYASQTLGVPVSLGTNGLSVGGVGAAVDGSGNVSVGLSGGASNAINGAVNSGINQVFGSTGFNLNSQIGSQALNGAEMIADDAFIRPAQGTNGSVDAAFTQLVNGGFGQVLQGTPANNFNFLAATALSGANQNYSPAVGSYSTTSNLVNSILTNGASSSSPQAASAYANFNQIASLVAANPSQYLVGGSKLTLSNADVTNFQNAQQNGTAPSVTLSGYSLTAMTRKSSTYLVGNFPGGNFLGGNVFQFTSSNPISAIMSAGPSMGTAGQLLSSFNAANGRVGALDLTKTTTQQYIQYTTQILQATIQIEVGLEALSKLLTDTQKNAIPQLAQMQNQTQEQIKMLQDKIQALTNASTQLDQQIYGQLQNYDAAYAAAVKEASQRAPLIAHAASVEAQSAANPVAGSSSTTYVDPFYGKRFQLVHVEGQRGLVLALR